MPSWLIKAALQNAMGKTSRGHSLNYLFQKHVTRSVKLHREWFNVKLNQIRSEMQGFRDVTGRADGPSQVLEIGTGWHPVTPIAFFLCGSDGVTTVDIVDLLRPETVGETVDWLLDYAERGELLEVLPFVRADRLDAVRALQPTASTADTASTLSAMHIQAIVGDARSLPLGSHSVDLVVSNNVFEHIKVDVFPSLMNEFHRVLKSDGAMIHYIDMSDHYSHFDSSITEWHFLRFSDRAWRIFDSPIVPQNRLRIPDHRAIHRNAGFSIVDERPEQGKPELPAEVKLDSRFQHYGVADLLVTHCYVTSVPEPSVRPESRGVAD